MTSNSIDNSSPQCLVKRVNILRDIHENKCLQRLVGKSQSKEETEQDSLDVCVAIFHQANLEAKENMVPNIQRYSCRQHDIRICEAVDCYEPATETIIVSAGKFGTINLNLCHKCAVTKFQSRVNTVPLVPVDSNLYSRMEDD